MRDYRRFRGIQFRTLQIAQTAFTATDDGRSPGVTAIAAAVCGSPHLRPPTDSVGPERPGGDTLRSGRVLRTGSCRVDILGVLCLSMPSTGSRGSVLDRSVLEAALEGLEAQRVRLDEQISRVRSLLGSPGRGRPHVPSAGADLVPSVAGALKKRTMSAAARRRIAAAQKKRWAAWRKKRGS
jgi:hypothetical protein